jgi:glutamyl-tRNA synthetase
LIKVFDLVVELDEVALKHAVKNAVEFGEPEKQAVVGKVFSQTDKDPSEVLPVVENAIEQASEMSEDELSAKKEQYTYESNEKQSDPVPNLETPNGEEVVVRFAPNPNAPPHIGHARGMVINGELRDKYDGKLILRFDDTDPATKRPMKQAYEMYKEDYKWLGYEPDEIRYSSKNFDEYIQHAEQLIEQGQAYVCKCSQKQGQEYRKNGEPCPHRDQEVNENMALWNGMRDGSVDQGEAVLKIKTDMDHKNPAVRDFVGFRIIDSPDHPITGNQYRVWPLLDFQGAIEDHLMETTHIVRGKDLRASTKRQKYIYRYFNWDYPEVMYWGNVQISGFDVPVSGSTITQMIDEGDLQGWEDPRAPTLRALRNRGFQPEAIQNFFIEMGVTENDVEASVESLEKENTRAVDSDADRCFFVAKPVKLEVDDVPNGLEADMQVHPEHPERGSRSPELGVESSKLEVYIDKEDMSDGFCRLKGLCNIEISGDSATYVEGDHKDALDENADFIHWAPKNAGAAQVRMPDNTVVEGRIEPNSADPGEVVQFERFGFVRKDHGNVFYYAHQ